MHVVRRRLLAALAVGATLAFSLNVGAQSYPSKPIRLIVPFAAGGSSDVQARALAKQLGEQMGAQMVVENRPGAGGTVGVGEVVKAVPDGHTLLFGTIGTNGISPALFRSLPYDPQRDLIAVSSLASLPNVLIVHSSLGINTVAELIAYAKANPGKLTFASAGNGSVSHLAGEVFKQMAGVEMTHVPYKGGGAAFPDLLAGNVLVMFETITNAVSAAKSGRVKALAVTTAQRWPTAPDLPPIADTVPGYQVDSWTGLFVPAGTPKAIVDRLNAEVVKAAKDPGYRQVSAAQGVEATSSTPEAFAAFVRAEVAKWTRAVQASGAKVD